MFESADIGHAIDKDTYEAAVPALREALLEAQFELQQQKRFPVIILINGIEGAGKGETVKLLNEWMDPRLIEVRTFDQQTDEELARPPAWRYWRMLPAKGRMAGEGGELVRRGDERQTGKCSQLGGNRFAETVGRIEPGADGCTALGQFAHGRQR